MVKDFTNINKSNIRLSLFNINNTSIQDLGNPGLGLRQRQPCDEAKLVDANSVAKHKDRKCLIIYDGTLLSFVLNYSTNLKVDKCTQMLTDSINRQNWITTIRRAPFVLTKQYHSMLPTIWSQGQRSWVNLTFTLLFK